MILRPALKTFKLLFEISAKLILGKSHLLVRFPVNCVESPLQRQFCGGSDLGERRLGITLDSLNSLSCNLDDAFRLDLSLLQALNELLDHIRTPPVWIIAGRDGGIRTHDLLVPNQALYQAEPHPDK
jgi:hypothetical protein